MSLWLGLLFAVTTGAAPGYVDDALCGDCHPDKWATYRHVGMAKSFYRPRADKHIEDFAAPPYFHAPSQQFLEIRREGDRLVFRRWQAMADGTPYNSVEQSIDWILGSGHHSRVYLYQTPSGELYQLPLAWYTQSQSWRMAPGFDRADHDGITRRVRHECLFCHNGYPEIAPQTLSHFRPQSFPRELPEGTGCQRCHGPGGAHIDAVRRGGDAKAAIVNPAKLDAKRRNDVCYECHLVPDVALPGMRRFGRDIYSFRPGQALADYVVHLDTTQEGVARDERFEINHHPYRLEQSPCFQRSEGKLSCLSCHDPHRKVPQEQRAAHYRSVCAECHQSPHAKETTDCVSCHMPQRRTQDVVHVVMTDHFIRRKPGGAELLMPIEERDPDVVDAQLLDAASTLSPKEQELYRVIPLLRARGGADRALARRLSELLAELKPADVEPYLDLAMAELRLRLYADLERSTAFILARWPRQHQAMEWQALARAARTRKRGDAISVLSELVERSDVERPETEFNLGVMLMGDGRTREAIPHFERVVAERPNLAAAWYRLGEAYAECGDRLRAEDAWRRTLAIDPRHAKAQAALQP